MRIENGTSQPMPRSEAKTQLAIPQGHTVQDLEVMARKVAQSKLFGLDEAQTFTLMLLSQADGIHPIHAMRRYHVVKGRPTMKADAMLADMQKRGWRVEWLTEPNDGQKQAARFTHATRCPEGKTIPFTMDDAKRADLTGSDMYRKYPSNMLRARMISIACKMLDPDVTVGIYTPEEADAMEPLQATVEVKEHHAVNHDNQTGHGSGAYAPPETVKAYQGFVESMVSDINQKWLDRITDQHGEMLTADGELLSTWQLSGHLLKWARSQGWVNAPEDVRAGQRDKFAAVAWEGHMGLFTDEARAYATKLWNAALKKIKAAKPAQRRENLPLPDNDDELMRTEAGARG